MFSIVALLMDLVLFCADERAFVDVWVDFDVGVVGELEGIPSAGLVQGKAGQADHLLAIVENHDGDYVMYATSLEQLIRLYLEQEMRAVLAVRKYAASRAD